MFIKHRKVGCGRYICLGFVLGTGDQQTLHRLSVFCQFCRSTVQCFFTLISLGKQGAEFLYLLFHICNILQNFLRQSIHGHTVGSHDMGEHLTVDISELSGKSAYLFLLCNLFGYDLITRPDHTLQRPYQHSDTADRRNCQKQQQHHDLNADADSSFSLSCIFFFPLSFSLIHTLLLYATNKYHQKGLRHKSAGPFLIRYVEINSWQLIFHHVWIQHRR